METSNKKTEEENWIFMWGTAPIVPSFWATPKYQKERPDLPFPGESSFQYYDGESLTMYMRESEVEKTKEESYGLFDIEENYNDFVSNFEDEEKGWWSWIDKMQSKDFSSVSREELKDDYDKHTQLHRDALAYFGATRPEPNHAVEQKLREIIKDQVGEDWSETFGLLTTPRELDDVQKQQLDLARLNDKTTVSDEQLLEHARKFPWFVFGQFDEEKVLDYLKDSLSDYDGSSYETLKQEHQEDLQETKQKQETFFDELETKTEKEARHLSRVLREQSVRRMEIKSFWVGSYFLIRDFWKALAKELNVEVWDFMNYLMPPEVSTLLAKDENLKKDVSELLKKRQDAYVISYQGRDTIDILDGQEAKKAYEHKIETAKKKEQKMVEGQTAVPGEYGGEVRKIMPGDLDDLQDDIETFQKGEVLVTTMTQPNMVVMMKKAGAIVTDEGGITSHAAIVSRELDVPCVVGCLNAMEVFENGDKVRVDAQDGTIRKISDHEQ